jgi:hypothetical protein
MRSLLPRPKWFVLQSFAVQKRCVLVAHQGVGGCACVVSIAHVVASSVAVV